MRIRYSLNRQFMRLIHHYGFHYAPKKPTPSPHESRLGIDGMPLKESYRWCQWCGLRGKTIEIDPDMMTRP